MKTSDDYWNLFLETGAPECYLMFRSAARMEERNVFENTGSGTPSDGIQ